MPTPHITIDFETYSEAGFTFNNATRKWDGLLNASKKGLPGVGMAVYAKHPSTRILSLAYKLPGLEIGLWVPGQVLPCDFIYDLNNTDYTIEAWNVGFERWIWDEVAVPLYGFPPIRESRWRCAAAKSRAYALPGNLGDAGKVLQTTAQKNKDGMRLINKFSCPRNPTIKDSRLRILPQDDPEDAKLLYAYNLDDVKAELEISALIPDLSPFELRFWQADQRINHRGVQLDMVSVLNCLHIIEQAHEKYNKELPLLTNGAVTASSQIARIGKWLESVGTSTDSLDEDHITELLNNPLLLPQVRRVLEIRQLIGSAGVKKLYKMLTQSTTEGRVYDLFIYHAARTGRAAGEGIQPQNMPRGQEGFDVKEALKVINTGSLDKVEAVYGTATETVSNCLRGMFIAKPGCELISSDYSAIEAVVLAELAGEEWRREVFRTHGKIYEDSASRIANTPLSEILEYKEKTGKHHDLRKLGKVAELACFSSDTEVLTNRGYVRITGVLKSDLLWDGIQWVTHAGVIAKGQKKTLNLDGVQMTENHLVYTGSSWRKAKEIVSDVTILTLCLATASGSLPLFIPNLGAQKGINWPIANAIVGIFQNLILGTLGREELNNVKPAPITCIKEKEPREKRGILNMNGFYQMLSNAKDYLLKLRGLLVDVITQKMQTTETTERAELAFAMNGGGLIEPNILRTLLGLPGGTTPYLTWIGSIITKGMNRVILNFPPALKICSIEGKFLNCNKESSNLSPVYDIVNAGPNHRFTIKTNSGHLIVHNCGYGGWLGAWKAFGADEFLSEDEIKCAILTWRAASPAIVEFWGGQSRNPYAWEVQLEYYGVEGAAVQAVLYPGTTFHIRSISFTVTDNILFCELPSGRRLTYHKPRLDMSERRPGTYDLSYEGWNSNPKNGAPGWIRQSTYGGKLVENCIAEGTKVLTNSGWKNVQDITDVDLVHDGIDFVEHGGILLKSVQGCIAVDGVLITPDHKVLNNDLEWKTAWETKEPFRPKIRNDYCLTSYKNQWKKVILDVSMRMWDFSRSLWYRYIERHKKRSKPFLWLSNEKTTSWQQSNTRNEQASSICDMACYARPLSTFHTSSMGKLRRSWDNGMYSMARRFRELLAGYERQLQVECSIRSNRQQSRIFKRELSMGFSKNKYEQQKIEYNNRRYNSIPSFRTIWNKCHNYFISIKQGLANGKAFHNTGFSQQRVYDILNCGPRKRFVVKGNNGPFIVHNCTQAVARDILAHAVVALEDADFPVVLHVHDEIVAEIPQGSRSIDEFEGIMSTMPTWASDWPVVAKGGWRGKRYQK